MTERYNIHTNDYVEWDTADQFLEDLLELCKKHDVTIENNILVSEGYCDYMEDTVNSARVEVFIDNR